MVCKLMLQVLAFAALVVSQARAAGNDMGAYIYLKQNSDLFVGEGVAKLADFQDDLGKAIEAAKERARADLASGIQVRVSSETSEKLESKDGKASEELKSQSRSQSDLSLENIKYIEFKGMPAEGQVTVLASLSKQDYRRQLAGKKVSVFLPEHGFKIKATMDAPNWLAGHYQPGLNLGLEYLSGDFVYGLMFEGDDVDATNKQGPKAPPMGPSTGDHSGTTNLSRGELDLGYDWTPWARRSQVFFPLRLQYQRVSVGQLNADLFGANAGLGYRFWPSDSFALELTARYGLGFNTVELQPYATGYDPLQANLTGLQIDIGLLWSGF